MEKQHFNYCFKITSPVTRFNLPYPIRSVKELKVKFLRFETQSANNQVMLIKISQFNNNVYYDGTTIVKYAKAIALPPSANTPVIFENPLPESDVTIAEKTSAGDGISNLTIEIMIDNLYSADINVSNPVHMEISIY